MAQVPLQCIAKLFYHRLFQNFQTFQAKSPDRVLLHCSSPQSSNQTTGELALHSIPLAQIAVFYCVIVHNILSLVLICLFTVHFAVSILHWCTHYKHDIPVRNIVPTINFPAKILLLCHFLYFSSLSCHNQYTSQQLSIRKLLRSFPQKPYYTQVGTIQTHCTQKHKPGSEGPAHFRK